ncbi:hypothetical protein [Paenibacillus xylanivorans]|uniref:hypothetical protein n=1 Tax=Paenibacillus xylanivorans TaxID=1705561 RepID=UPI000B1819BE|nr:hypothetical protein [Paenibacillus xylanivorans]
MLDIEVGFFMRPPRFGRLQEYNNLPNEAAFVPFLANQQAWPKTAIFPRSNHR